MTGSDLAVIDTKDGKTSKTASDSPQLEHILRYIKARKMSSLLDRL